MDDWCDVIIGVIKMTDEIDDIFKKFDEIFEAMMKQSNYRDSNVFPWTKTREYSRDRNVLRAQDRATREEIFQNDDNVVIVMELGYGYNEDSLVVKIIERNERRILQVKSKDDKFTRRYALTSDMTGEFKWCVNNGILEIILYKVTEVVELGK